MRIRRVFGIVALGIAAANSCAMAGYHFALPVIWHWSRFVGGIPATIRWGLFAINVFFSFLLLAGGALTGVAARVFSRGASPDRGVLVAMAGFWTLNMLYQVIVPMPLPAKLWPLHLLLPGYAALTLLAYLIGLRALRAHGPA
ncbi:MAG: hypothetical protein A3H96_25620 [Acidobacteria bacterium RIFCSPLOWO2_02_FULL_67_36]|nr:MAG: hypothetical protein A3H96_25620 [Acidobacteria bacterium RIFCSPLOWO2_02_FULL_67_36]OFW22549.1 MAG: hypothetical protein A3G21_13810 [Acidobacteria bacterium RIFCSPLOWO2_12_FULL_66_21]